MWCIATITPQYRERMYSLLDLYEQGGSCQYPIVCVDEKSKQLISDVRSSIPLRPGSKEKYDYEYKRQGTRNIFVAVEPFAGRRKIKVTKTRKKDDFAIFIKELIDQCYPNTERINLVLDNLNTHFESSFYQAFSQEEAKRILSKINFCYTPKHASWLNMAEIEINMLDRECLSPRIESATKLENQIRAWEKQRNVERKRISWSFTKQDADCKLSKHYVA
jgi:hypothetical protein